MNCMREIKFRQLIWDYDDDKLLEWHYWGIVNGKFIEPIINGVNPENNYKSQQFTGLKDKNGKEIYEGDLLKYGGVINEVKYIKELCIYDDIFGLYFASLANQCEVIGNIFENPELINYSLT